MALITLKGRREPIEISNETALRIKQTWENKPSPNDIVNLGWIQFSFGQLKVIEMTRERKAPDEDYNRPLTSEERKHRDEMMAKVRANLESKNIIRKKEKNHIQNVLLEKAENY